MPLKSSLSKRCCLCCTDMSQGQPQVTILRWVKPALNSTQERDTKKCSYSVVTYFTDFCKATSFHGFKYITEEGRHWIER